jgi:toxin ParE1/3/4
MKPFQLAPAAANELDEAADWYEGRQPGLADRLLDEFEGLVADVQHHPAAFPRVHGLPPDLEVRRASVPRFPYILVFLELEDEIRGLAVSHVRREPLYWTPRILR